MRVLAFIGLAIVAIVVVFLAWWASQTPTYVHRFRLVIEAEAEGEVRRGASVIEVRTTDYKVGLPHTTGFRSRVRGEAVFVDLGQGRHVIAILGFGPTGSRDGIAGLAWSAFRRSDPRLQVSDVPDLEGSVDLHGDLIPTLVTFRDIDDPTSARVVLLDQFETVFGPDVHFRGARLEMVPAGIWPLTLFGIGGEPITRGIEERLPWVKSLRGYLHGKFACNPSIESCLEVGQFGRE